MTLKQVFENTLQDYNKREEELQRLVAEAKGKLEALNNRETALHAYTDKLANREKEIKHIEDVAAQGRINEDNKKALDAKDIELKKKEIELKKYENKLVEIKDRQDKTDKELRDRELALVEREKHYKEELQRSFADNFAAKLLNK